ncbi:hypothetical protein WME76_11685 [Sorangium sp. So ce119]|uniref:hypothetical protein n=1 Tax=Sorangium sp. So ce119 TaxID=3133279 RepID=UPI003F6049B5
MASPPKSCARLGVADIEKAEARFLHWWNLTPLRRALDNSGMAHDGLAADRVEEVRLEGGEAMLTALYNPAEVYLQTWERTLDR